MPIYEVYDNETGLTLEMEGDNPPTDADIRQAFADVSADVSASEHARKTIEAAAGGVETAASLLSGMVAAPAAGFAGLYDLAASGGDTERASGAVRAVQDALTYQPRTAGGRAMTAGVGGALEPVGQVFQEVGKVAGAEGERLARNVGAEPGGAGAGVGYAVGTAAPEAILASVGGVPARVARAAPAIPAGEAGAAQIIERAANVPAGTIRQAPRQAAIREVAETAQPRADVVESARTMGFEPEDVPPEVLSGSPEFRMAAGAARSMVTPEGMALASNLRQFADSVAQRAKAAGERANAEDYAGLNERLTETLRGDIDRIKSTENDLYGEIRNTIVTPAEVMDISPAVTFVNEGLAKVRGDASSLGEAERAVASIFGNFVKDKNGKSRFVPKKEVTWHALDNFRIEANSQVGAGRFKDFSEASKRRAAGVVSSTQKANAERLGFGKQFNNALEISKARFAAQDAAQAVLGKDLDKSFSKVFDTRMTQASKGAVAELETVLQNLPRVERGRAVSSYVFGKMIDKTSDGGSRLNTAAFNDWFNSLSNNPTAKATVYKYLTPEARRDIEAIGKVTNAVERATAEVVPTGRLLSAEARFRPVGPIRRILSRMATSRVAGIDPTGAVPAVAAEMAGKTSKVTDAAAQVMASPEFRSHVVNITRRADEAAMRASESALRDSPAWRRFNAALPAETRRKIAGVGVAAWLASEDEQ